MKVLKKCLICLMAGVMFVGCGEKSNEPPTDEDLILNISKGLEARWKEADKTDSEQLSASELQKQYKELIKLEKENIGDLSDYDLKDTELKETVENYLKGLNLQEEGIQYVGTDDYTNQANTWDLGYDYRICALHDLNSNFGLTVSDNYSQDLDDLLAEYSVAKKHISIQDYVNTLSDKVEYKKNEDLSDEYTTYYSAIIENDTDYTIDSLEIGVDFLDSNGVSIYQSTDFKNNIAPGAKVQSDIYYDTAKGDPTDIQVNITAYYN